MSGWWGDVLRASAAWTNHHVKYDAHVSANDLNEVFQREMRCTLTRAKLIDSDRIYKGGYGLDVLSEQLLEENIDKYGRAMLPYLEDSKDYGDVPLDILAEYACVDVRTNIKLDVWQEQHFPAVSDEVWETSKKFERVLFDMERRGMLIDRKKVKRAHIDTIKKMLEKDYELEKLIGRVFSATSNKDCYDVLCNQFGLPVLAWTEPSERADGTMSKPGPSFDADALALYLDHPDAPTEIVQGILDYRKLSTFQSLFVGAWEKKGHISDDSRLHPTFNGRVRTGRLSASEPNPQQFDTAAKSLVEAPEGYGIICADYSQVEYRVLVHYLENRRCIQMYQDDPWTDFHQMIADSIPCSRDAAKTLNFAIGFGQGKKKTIAALAINKKFVGTIWDEIVNDSTIPPEARRAAVERACAYRATAVFDKYHADLPELRSVRERAAAACRARGSVRNHYGALRHLPEQAAHTALPSLCQSTAGELCRERMVALAEEVPEFEMFAQVHDEVAGYAPLELCQDERFLRKIVKVLESPSRPFRVPIKAAIGWGPNWAIAKSDDAKRKFV